jgi:uncharacterized protein (TIGR02246 family)
MKLQALTLALLIAAIPSTGYAKADSIPQKDTDAIVLKFQANYADTFNHRDAKEMAALLTENSTLQNEWGDVTKGRANIESLVANLMAKLPAETKLEDTSLSAESVSANVIVSQGISHRVTPNADPVQMFFTRVLVREGGKWKMAATQIARPSTVPKPTAPAPAK